MVRTRSGAIRRTEATGTKRQSCGGAEAHAAGGGPGMVRRGVELTFGTWRCSREAPEWLQRTEAHGMLSDSHGWCAVTKEDDRSSEST